MDTDFNKLIERLESPEHYTDAVDEAIEALKELRNAGDSLSGILNKYQARYHGAAHAQKDHDLAARVMDRWKVIRVNPCPSVVKTS